MHRLGRDQRPDGRPPPPARSSSRAGCVDRPRRPLVCRPGRRAAGAAIRSRGNMPLRSRSPPPRAQPCSGRHRDQHEDTERRARGGRGLPPSQIGACGRLRICPARQRRVIALCFIEIQALVGRHPPGGSAHRRRHRGVGGKLAQSGAAGLDDALQIAGVILLGMVGVVVDPRTGGIERGSEHAVQLIAVANRIAARLLGERVDVVVGSLEGHLSAHHRGTMQHLGQTRRTQPRHRGSSAPSADWPRPLGAASDRGSHPPARAIGRPHAGRVGRPAANTFLRHPRTRPGATRPAIHPPRKRTHTNSFTRREDDMRNIRPNRVQLSRAEAASKFSRKNRSA